MKLNNKGTSLIELIVSIAMISVILIFMFRLLTDVNNDEVNPTYAKDNQVIRAEIIKFIESDLSGKSLKAVTSGTGYINFSFKETTNLGKLVFSSSNKTVSYTNSSGEIRKWTMKEADIDNTANICSSGTGDDSISIYTLSIIIPIYTENDLNSKDKNNPVDDIILSYIGKQGDLGNKSILNNICH